MRVKTRHLVFYGGGLGAAAAGGDLAAEFEEAFGAQARFLVGVGVGKFGGGDFLAVVLAAEVEGEALTGEFEFFVRGLRSAEAEHVRRHDHESARSDGGSSDERTPGDGRFGLHGWGRL